MGGLTRFNKAEPRKDRLIFDQLDAQLQLKNCIAQLPRQATGVLQQNPRLPPCPVLRQQRRACRDIDSPRAGSEKRRRKPAGQGTRFRPSGSVEP